jgi:hypothetical protein
MAEQLRSPADAQNLNWRMTSNRQACFPRRSAPEPIALIANRIFRQLQPLQHICDVKIIAQRNSLFQ